jgi:predicted transposase/invertase (TIGR01784 family)
MWQICDSQTHGLVRLEGRDEVIAIGIEKGIGVGIVKIARNMKAADIALEMILQVTGLSREDIEKI